MPKETYWFKHDYNARGDEKIVKLLRILGPKGYGCYWILIEKLYEADGRITMDAENLAYDMRVSLKFLQRVISDFKLFFSKDGQLGSHSVDRRLRERRGKSEQARQAAFAGVALRKRSASAQRPMVDRSAIREDKIREEEKRKDTSPFVSSFCEYNDRGQGRCEERKVEGSRFCQGHKLKVREKALIKREGPLVPGVELQGMP